MSLLADTCHSTAFWSVSMQSWCLSPRGRGRPSGVAFHHPTKCPSRELKSIMLKSVPAQRAGTELQWHGCVRFADPLSKCWDFWLVVETLTCLRCWWKAKDCRDSLAFILSALWIFVDMFTPIPLMLLGDFDVTRLQSELFDSFYRASPADWFNLQRVVLRSEATYNPGSGKRGPKLWHVLKVFFQSYFSKVFILLFIFFLPFSLAQTPRASNSCGDTLPFSWVNTNVIPWYRHWWSVTALEWRTEERLRGEMSRNHKDVQLTFFRLKRRKVKRRWTWNSENIRNRLSTKKQTSADQHGQQILWNISNSLTFKGVPWIY